MNMKEYAKKIAEIAKKYPDATVVYDDPIGTFEYLELETFPIVGLWDDGSFTQEDLLSEEDEKPNAVCINF